MIHTTEAQVQAGFAVVLHGRTIVVIARCLSTVRAADRIIVLRSFRYQLPLRCVVGTARLRG
jgi:ABC-type transport system involved in Fe-S cluster assembly fused permease/ATPase subunit